MSITEAFELYRLDRIVFKNQTTSTENQYDRCLRSITDTFGDVNIESIGFPMVRQWKLTLEKTRGVSTVRNYLGQLRNVLKYAQKQGIKTMDYDLIELPRRDPPRPTFIEPSDVKRLIDSCVRIRSKAIISMLYGSGIRLSELISLNRSDIKGNRFVVRGKNKKVRPCFLDARTKKYLEMYLATRKDNHEALFVSTQHNTGSNAPLRMTPTNVQLILKIARHKAGITEKVSPHTLRHSFATNLLNNKCDIRFIQQFLGHENISTTMMYTHVTDPRLQEAYAQSHSF